jgi:hypothetical protein
LATIADPSKGVKCIMANTSVYGIFKSRAQLEPALLDLQRGGFRPQDVSVLLPENLGNKDLVTQKATKSPEGAATGGATGGVLGGALGWLAATGALAIPGVGPFIAAGPIIGALAGLGAGAALGGVAGGLIGMGMPEFEAKRFEGRVKEGGILMSVHCDDSNWCDRAEEILRSAGATDITRSGEASADYDKTDKPHARVTGTGR